MIVCNDIQPSKIYVGENAVSKVYRGENVIYQSSVSLPLAFEYGTYSNNLNAYVDSTYRLKMVLYLGEEILKRAKSMEFQINSGYKYSRQLFGSTSDSSSNRLDQLFNDSAWQTKTTTLDLTSYGRQVVTFGMLLYSTKSPEIQNPIVIVHY